MSSWKTTTQQREDEWPNDHVLWTCLRGPKVFGTCTFYSSPQSGVSQPSSSESSIIWGISARYMLKVLELLIASKWEIALIQNLLNWRKMRRCLEMSSGHLFDEYVKLITKSITFGTPKLVPQKKNKKKLCQWCLQPATGSCKGSLAYARNVVCQSRPRMFALLGWCPRKLVNG